MNNQDQPKPAENSPVTATKLSDLKLDGNGNLLSAEIRITLRAKSKQRSSTQ